MQPTQKPDIAKIIFIGIPLLLMFWGLAFALLALLTRDINISKYGAIVLFLLAIPTYGFITIKNASKLKVVLHENEEEIRKGIIKKTGKKKSLDRYIQVTLMQSAVPQEIKTIFLHLLPVTLSFLRLMILQNNYSLHRLASQSFCLSSP